MTNYTIADYCFSSEQHLTFLKERMEADFGLLDTMLTNGTIGWSDKESIESQNSPSLRNSKLLHYILERDQCDGLIMALKESDQTHIVNYLTANGGKD